MLSIKSALAASLVSAFALFSAPETQAATVTLDFNSPVPAPLTLDPDSPGIINGRCAGSASGAPCLGVNSVGEATLAIEAGETFSVSSFWFQLLGNMDDLIVTTSNGTLTLLESVYGFNDGGQVIDVSGNALFQNITSLSFLTNTGNARVDDIVVDIPNVAPIPLPASAVLLLAGMGGLTALRRRKKLA